MHNFLLIAAASYLLGSIPFGYLLVRMFRGEDIRRSGSGNIGATNVSRKSPALGALTLLLDAAKGFCSVELALSLSQFQPADPRLFRIMAAAALLAIAGHMFPIWLRFRGGKGVATALGAFVRVSPLTVLIAILIFIVVVFVTRRISLGSIVTAAFFPVVMWYANSVRDAMAIALVAAASALIIARHHQNIRRLISGEEPRFALKRK
jgi:acyl phosphate:glycerol-3-phosphate acyltransferase